MRMAAILMVSMLSAPISAFAQVADSVGNVLGSVYSVETRQPLVGAEIVLPALGRSTLSDAEGHFSFRNVPAGPTFAHASYIGHHPLDWILYVEPDKALQVEVRMYVDAIKMVPIEVTVRSNRWRESIEGLRYRIRQGLGEYVTRREIEQKPRGWNVAQLLRGIPGVRITESRYGETVSLRGGGGLGDGSCPPTFYLDGREFRGDLSSMNVFQSHDVEAIEVYRSSSTAPIQFRGGNCGTIILWTRLGGRPSGPPGG